ncbi:MAG: putative zinc-binding protein [candidate division KSB1 bacterium]|nr:putative zinc-binding protein [candidate division KSB1 bacterium]
MNANKKTILIACSGASNTGAYSDKVARKLMATGNAKMLCLARLAVDEKWAETQKKSCSQDARIVVLDGCPIDCAATILNERGIHNFEHVHTTDFGIVKGKTPVTEEKIDEIVEYLTTR